MTHLTASAGMFELECFTDGHPHWVDIHLMSKQIARIDAEDLPDLLYAIGRLRQKIAEDSMAKNAPVPIPGYPGECP